MKFINNIISVRTAKRCQMVDITEHVHQSVEKAGIQNGYALVFCPHTTAAITINENADPDVVSDILTTLERLIPKNHPEYRHCEGNSDAHVKSSLVGASQQILVQNGRLCLGTWQAIFFCEFDGPRNRNVYIQVAGQ